MPNVTMTLLQGQKTAQNEQLYLKNTPPELTLSSEGCSEAVTEEELLKRKANLESLLAEVEADLALIAQAKIGLGGM